MSLRCPFCHVSLGGGEARASCRRCEADSHAECALELGRCAACAGPVRLDEVPRGWERVEASVGSSARFAYRRVSPRDLPEGEPGGSLELRLDVPRREVPCEGFLVADVELLVRVPTALGPLWLSLEELRTRRRWFSARTRAQCVARVPLLGSWSSGGSLRRTKTGLYAPGSYRAQACLPLVGLAPTADAPGSSELLRYRLSACLGRRRDQVRSGIEVRLANNVDCRHVPHRVGLEGVA